jgi:2-polyprenyl-3-methyl-5-hydroxy-6-metoxy-1,4-benzoquinol methylase
MKLKEIDLCPLCESIDTVEIEKIRYRDIWNGLEKEWRVSFSKKVIEGNSPSDLTTLVNCRICGLQYFVPIVSGNSQFYYELSQSPIYYSGQKWEFPLVTKSIKPEDKLLDIGCGDGYFLDSIKNRVSQAMGIDTNAEAIKRAKGRGLDVRLINIEGFSTENKGKFSVVCCFHVIEHLDRVRPFLNAAISCLEPRGKLVLSVPNRQNISKSLFESLDCPPHHVSRWEANQLRMIADVMGIDLDKVVLEVAGRNACHKWLREKIASEVLNGRYEKLNMWVGKGTSFVLFLSPLYRLYRKVGLLEKWGLYQLSMLAFYKKRFP